MGTLESQRVVDVTVDPDFCAQRFTGAQSDHVDELTYADAAYGRIVESAWFHATLVRASGRLQSTVGRASNRAPRLVTAGRHQLSQRRLPVAGRATIHPAYQAKSRN